MTSNFQRDDARLTLSRMQREIRDAEARAGNLEPALYRAHTYYVAFFTTFNDAGNTKPSAKPHLVAYKLYGDGTLWRFSDKNDDGQIDGVAGVTPNIALTDPENPTNYDTNEWLNGEGASEVLANVVNFSRPAGPVPMFTYFYYDTTGKLKPSSVVTGATNRTNTTAASSRILEDLKPGHSPVYVDLEVTSQMRNQR